MKKILTLMLITTFVVPFSLTIANAHSGGTNSDGCHNNRKTGSYHCH